LPARAIIALSISQIIKGKNGKKFPLKQALNKIVAGEKRIL
jgi:hypothetical protein